MSDLLDKEKSLLYSIQCVSSRFPELGKQLEIPSVILLGIQSAGKSSLLDCLANINRFSDTGQGTKTRIPIKVNLRSSDDGPEPKITWISSDKYVDNTVMSVIECQDYVQGINNRISQRKVPFLGVSEMLNFNVSSSECHNLSIIDLPGLRTAEYADVVKNIALELLETIRDSFILVLEGPESDWDNPSDAVKIILERPAIKKRAILVKTKLSLKLKQLQNEQEYQKFFSGATSDAYKDWLAPPFIVDCGNPEDRSLLGYDVHDFIDRIDRQSQNQVERIKNSNPGLYSDVKDRIGVFQLRNCLQRSLTQKLIGSAGSLTSGINRKKNELDREIRDKINELNNSSDDTLESDLTALFTAWWRIWNNILEGTAHSHILEEYGMTIEDERIEFGNYVDARGAALKPPLDGIFGANHKLVGGPQLKRIIDEFYEIANEIMVESTSEHAVINSIRPGTTNDGIDLITGCSKIVCIKAREELNPLISQLVTRCGKVMERLPDICRQIVLEESTALRTHLREFDAFWDWLKGVYIGFVESTMKRCEEYTRYDFWAATEYIEIDDKHDTVLKDEIEAINRDINLHKTSVSQEVWARDSAARIVPVFFRILLTNFFKNAKRKLHVFFLLGFGESAPDPRMTLHFSLHREFMKLDVKKLFDVEAIKDRLSKEIEILKLSLEEIVELEKQFKEWTM